MERGLMSVHYWRIRYRDAPTCVWSISIVLIILWSYSRKLMESNDNPVSTGFRRMVQQLSMDWRRTS